MRTKKSLGSAVRISTRIHHVAPIDGKESADKRGAAKARLAGVKRPSLSSNPKGTRDLIMHGQWVLEKPALLQANGRDSRRDHGKYWQHFNDL
jgi:hypothetical protein